MTTDVELSLDGAGDRLSPVRRIAAYAVVSREDAAQPGRQEILLVRNSDRSGTPGVWSLPGGAVDHGEHPNDTAIRETAAETGLSISLTGLRDVLADLRALPHRGVTLHTDRLIYSGRVRGGALRDRRDQSTDLVRWVSLAEAGSLSLRPFTANALGLPAADVDLRPDEVPDFPSFHIEEGHDGLHRTQRFAAYAVATDQLDRVLLTRVSPGYPGEGRWHLPGGGTDFGEQPAHALIRELLEETGQAGRLSGLLGVASHRDPASLGPEGFPIDWHGVRAFYRVTIDQATTPTVHDKGGSTSGAYWLERDKVKSLGPDDMTEVTADALKAAEL
ncbi:ADP-ribose pyrophosphatase YjhB (NUDIX family) [Hamadaea flava]|uniref:NUDIX hydrolase n=1 Tax=Hamadaea flava TaxID=1742688 RepID=A0ABV8LH21_9ACTN|nr:NUDIX hydrolase [Hamadaea flava]MCP2326548.1 ADP-ribose pyrophosphatase YjhB (NUDIX family) [Hamadaea flava]